MRLQLSLSIDLSQAVNSVGGFSMADWADDVLAKLKNQQQQKQLQDAVFLERQQLKKAKGMPLWREVRQRVQENCEALNMKSRKSLLRVGVKHEMELFVASDIEGRHYQLEANFDEDAARLSWTCGEKHGQWDIDVLQDGSVKFTGGMVPTSPESIAKQMLDTLVFG
jgi:hypothetical protein